MAHSCLLASFLLCFPPSPPLPPLRVNWLIWPALQVLNFKFIPPALQVPVINVAILGWSAFLAIKANEGTEKEQEQEGEQKKEKEGVDTTGDKKLVAVKETQQPRKI